VSGTRNWREVRGERTLSEARVEAYRRLMDAQERIARVLADRGVSDAQIEAALAAAEAADPGDGQGSDPYLPMLERYVAALGGRLELQAVFPEATVTVDGSDESAAGPSS
jgi:hypothetical protein